MYVKMMKILVAIFVIKIVGAKIDEEPAPAQVQIADFRDKTKVPIGIMTTSAGAPVEFKDTSTLNSRLIFNEYFMDTLTHLARERIPERFVHAKAGGAFGFFEVTHDITDICKADLFNAVGKKTPIAARFSPIMQEKGGIDTSRDARGFAVKFYTQEGNFDMVGLNMPMFVVKDPLLFPTFVRSQKRNPATNLMDVNTYWDFLTSRPETLHVFLLIFGDRGIPDGYRHMPGYGIHTFQVVNKHGDSYFIRFHFLPDAGIKNLRSEDARMIAGTDHDYATRDLYNAIGTGNFPIWHVFIQVLSIEDVKTSTLDVFDVSKTLPMDKYPLRPLGKMILNRNPKNYFAEIEQLAFCPGNLVPGILGAPDKLFEARRFSYRDAQNYRLGVNFNRIQVNHPLHAPEFAVYNRDGKPPIMDNYGSSPNYYPNSFNGPVPYKDHKRSELIEIYEEDANNFEQAREIYVNEMTKDERSRLIENILYSLGGAIQELQDRAVKLYTLIHPDLGSRIFQGLQANKTHIQWYI